MDLIDVWIALAIVCLAVGGGLVAIAYVRMHRYLPRNLVSYAVSREALSQAMAQAEVPNKVRYTYVAGLCLMSVAPYLGLLDAVVLGRDALVWPFLVLCAIVSFATIITVWQAMDRQGPIA